MPVEQLSRLIYRSISKIGEADTLERSRQLRQILASARTYNQQHDITGMWFFNGSRFGQVLEGPRDAINKVMERVASDRRHDAIDLVRVEFIEARVFGDWSMALVKTDGGPLVSLQQPGDPDRNQAPWLMSPDQFDLANVVSALVRAEDWAAEARYQTV